MSRYGSIWTRRSEFDGVYPDVPRYAVRAGYPARRSGQYARERRTLYPDVGRSGKFPAGRCDNKDPEDETP